MSLLFTFRQVFSLRVVVQFQTEQRKRQVPAKALVTQSKHACQSLSQPLCATSAFAGNSFVLMDAECVLTLPLSIHLQPIPFRSQPAQVGAARIYRAVESQGV